MHAFKRKSRIIVSSRMRQQSGAFSFIVGCSDLLSWTVSGQVDSFGQSVAAFFHVPTDFRNISNCPPAVARPAGLPVFLFLCFTEMTLLKSKIDFKEFDYKEDFYTAALKESCKID